MVSGWMKRPSGVVVAGVVEAQAAGVFATRARNAPHARRPGLQRENAAVAPDAAGAADPGPLLAGGCNLNNSNRVLSLPCFQLL